jgi:hypothetical protein
LWERGVRGTSIDAGTRHKSDSRDNASFGQRVWISAENLAISLKECPALVKALNRFSGVQSLQAEQVAACNRLQEVEERLARWLLMCHDRLGGDIVPLTQDFLAHMLGTRRASVTVAAVILQKAGLIAYSRGIVKIIDRKNLEEASCECYETIVRQTQKWRTEFRLAHDCFVTFARCLF